MSRCCAMIRAKPVLLLPLVRKKVGPLHVGFFMGGKHTNFNLPVWRPEHLKQPAAGLNALLEGLRRNGPRLDLLVLLNQPATWQGTANPMLHAPHGESASRAYSGELQSDFEALLKERMGANSRKKLRQKERQLAALGPVAFQRARTHRRDRPGACRLLRPKGCAHARTGPEQCLRC